MAAMPMPFDMVRTAKLLSTSEEALSILDKLIAQPKLHKQIGDAACETVEQLYSQDALDSGSASIFPAPFGPRKQRAAEMLTDDANSKPCILNCSVKF